MKIVVTGGGSGGHITPILAVAAELKIIDSTIEIDYIGQKGDKFAAIPAADSNITAVYSVQAGKFRRYHGAGLRQLLDFPTVYKNIRDSFKVLAGFFQSFRLLHKIKPDVVFTRGGFISVPVGLAAAMLRIPYITHDSDGIPSLSNRIIARWAVLHAVALPEELYPYPRGRTLTVGVPVSEQYKPVTAGIQDQYRHELDLDAYKQVVFVTGGGLGAKRLNGAVVANAMTLLQQYPELVLIHNTGAANEAEVIKQYAALGSEDVNKRVKVKGFLDDLYKYSAAADVIVARGGATTIAEFAIQARACIIVPNPELTGGHQLKNVAALRDKKAVIELTEDQLMQEGLLARTIGSLLDSPAERVMLATQLATFARPDAAQHLAMVLLDQVQKSK